jgi:hypothetical protein
MKNTLISPYNYAEKNCGDRLKILLLQIYDMSDRHNLQIYEILSVFKSLIKKVESRSVGSQLKVSKRPPPANSSCGDDYKTRTKYKGPEKTLGGVLTACEYQVKDMFLIDHLDSETAFFLIKDLTECHIIEVDELETA